jgi:hypothetical protein
LQARLTSGQFVIPSAATASGLTPISGVSRFTAFYLLGFPGLIFAVLVLLLKEKPRGQTEIGAPGYSRKDWRVLFTSRPLIYLYLGYALFGLAANSLSIWGVTFVMRVYKLDLATIGW